VSVGITADDRLWLGMTSFSSQQPFLVAVIDLHVLVLILHFPVVVVHRRKWMHARDGLCNHGCSQGAGRSLFNSGYQTGCCQLLMCVWIYTRCTRQMKHTTIRPFRFSVSRPIFANLGENGSLLTDFMFDYEGCYGRPIAVTGRHDSIYFSLPSRACMCQCVSRAAG
jgi:hypothetical protein